MIKNILKYFHLSYSKVKHSDVLIGDRCSIRGDCSFSFGTAIDNDTYLRNVTLGCGSIIRARARLFDSNCAEHVVVNSDSFLESTNVGRFSYLGSSCHISQAEIGSFCSIGPELICGYGDHPASFISTHPVFFSLGMQSGVTFAEESLFVERSKICIGHDVWIGARVFIRDGVTIGNGAIVAAGSVVVKDIPPYAIIGGVPAKIIKYRFSEEVITRLMALEWWNWDETKLRAAQPFIACKDVDSFLKEFSPKKNGLG